MQLCRCDVFLGMWTENAYLDQSRYSTSSTPSLRKRIPRKCLALCLWFWPGTTSWHWFDHSTAYGLTVLVPWFLRCSYVSLRVACWLMVFSNTPGTVPRRPAPFWDMVIHRSSMVVFCFFLRWLNAVWCCLAVGHRTLRLRSSFGPGEIGCAHVRSVLRSDLIDT